MAQPVEPFTSTEFHAFLAQAKDMGVLISASRSKRRNVHYAILNMIGDVCTLNIFDFDTMQHSVETFGDADSCCDALLAFDGATRH